MKEAQKIKRLKSQLNKLEGDAEALKVSVINTQKDYQSKLKSIKDLKEQINSFEKDTTIRVSEHAILRYLERVKGINISEIEKEILSDEVLNLVNQLGGTGGYPNKDFKVLMKNYTVTTITKD